MTEGLFTDNIDSDGPENRCPHLPPVGEDDRLEELRDVILVRPDFSKNLRR